MVPCDSCSLSLFSLSTCGALLLSTLLLSYKHMFSTMKGDINQTTTLTHAYSLDILDTFDGVEDPKHFAWFMNHRKCSWCDTITGRWCESCKDTWTCTFTGSTGRALCSMHDQFSNVNMCKQCFAAKLGITMPELQVHLERGPGTSCSC